ncbi:MAG: glycosyltransferase [Anaerolineae bacterium]|nr:glycosyltransferase [Anaerolineae bacterium]
MCLRIAMLSNFYKPMISGVVTSISLFREGLIARGHDVHLFTTEAGDYEDESPYIYRIPALIDLTKAYEMALALPLAGTMRQTIKGIKPHLLHSHHPVWVGDLAIKYAHEFKLPLVFTFHTRYDEYLSQNIPFLSELAWQVAHDVVQNYLAQCAHVIAPTASIKNVLYRDYELDVPVTVLPTPIDLAKYTHLDPVSIRAEYELGNRQVLLYLGRISQEKNLDMLLSAFARLAAQNTQVVLMIVGRGPYSDTLKELASSLHIEERVIFTGVVPHEQVPHYMAAADLFVFPSKFETQSLVIIEALAAGTPVVAVHATGTDDVLENCRGGVLVEADEAVLADTILSLLSDPERLAEMAKSINDIASSYSIALATDRLLSVYEQAIASGPRLLARKVIKA